MYHEYFEQWVIPLITSDNLLCMLNDNSLNDNSLKWRFWPNLGVWFKFLTLWTGYNDHL